MKYIFLFACLAIPCLLFSQSSVDSKKVIGEDILSRWYWLEEGKWALSPDGKYASWVVVNQPYRSRTLVLAATEGSWRREFPGERGGFFAADNRRYILPMQGRIAVITLGEEKVRYIYNAERLRQDGEGHWMVWQVKDSGTVVVENLITDKSKQLEAMQSFVVDKSGTWLVGRPTTDSTGLLLYHNTTGKLRRYTAVESYKLKEDGRILVLHVRESSGSKLQHIRLADGKKSLVYATKPNEELVRYCMDSSGLQVAFLLRPQNTGQFTSGGNSIWSFETSNGNAHKVADDQSPGINEGLFISDYKLEFSCDGRYLVFHLQSPQDGRKALPDAVKVDVWSHRDLMLYTAQYPGYNPEQMPSSAVVQTTGGRVIRLTQSLAESVVSNLSGIMAIAGDHALVRRRQVGDRFWEYKRDSVWLISLKDGNRKLLPFIGIGWPNILELDAKGASVIGFDHYRSRHLYRYDIASGREQKISEGIADWQLGIENPFRPGWPAAEVWVNPAIAGRTRQGDALLVYDSYDLWQIDITGKKRAVNLTNGYGRRYKTVFRLALSDEAEVPGEGSLLLTGFNEVNKSNGFYRTVKGGDPDSLLMGPYFFAHGRKVVGNQMPEPNGTGMLPLKARAADKWMVCRESATEAPNYFFTRDFKRFRQLTDLQPQQVYNWYTTELVNFIQADGTQNQGILYKPADFDPTKKYPVIFHYYEQYSHTLNRFIAGRVSETGNPNIPWYVSRGYLIFRPDHYLKKGYRNKSTLLAAEGAARELMKRPYVDGEKLGLMGLSQGGEFTNYIVTHSNLFAAAFEGCGVSDQVSAALHLLDKGFKGPSSLQRVEEMDHGSSIWNSPMEWAGESSILNAHKITTPLLIMHNKADIAVPFEQAIELFTALRRLGKRVWLLQYDDGGHGVNGKDALDLTRRMTQYFDHYLKGLPPPKWMTKGIPAALKGIESRFELDPEGSCGKDCTICQKKDYKNNP